MPHCPEKSLACRVKALELGATGGSGGNTHPPAVLTYGGTQFDWDVNTQTGNIPIFAIWPFEAFGPDVELEVTGAPVYLHHAPMGMIITEGIRVSSPNPGTQGLEIMLYLGGTPMLANPLELAGATTWIPVSAIDSGTRTILAGQLLEVEIVNTPVGYGQWSGLVVDFCGVIDPNSGSSGNPPFNLVGPQIFGMTSIGSTLTSVPGTWSGNPVSFTYQWYVGGNPAAGQTGPTYIIQPGDAGLVIQLQVTAHNADGSSSVMSNTIVADVPGGIPVNTVAPVVSGVPAVGQLLSVNTGTWVNNPTSYAYQWYRNGSPIVGATASNYTVQPSDAGTAIHAAVTASNTYGSSSPEPSNTVNITTSAMTIYYGRAVQTNLSEALIIGLNTTTAVDPAGTYGFSAGNGYYYIAIPASLPEPVTMSVLSSGNPLVLAASPANAGYTGSTSSGLTYETVFVTSEGENYKVFRSFNTLSGADSIVITT